MKARRNSLQRKLVALLAAPFMASEIHAASMVMEEVVVTARKRSESLQDVPVAISAFSESQLKNRQVNDITDLERMTPNVTLGDTGGLVAGAVQVFVRGIGNDPGFDQGVGIYVDDVYLNRTSGALLKVYDVERIEILKGPQGNLYGRNTIGGAIKYVTRQPGPETLANVEFGTGSFDRYTVKADISGALIEDSLYGSFGIMRSERDGIQKDRNSGETYWGEDALAARTNLLWEMAPGHRLKFQADFMRDTSAPRIPNRLAVDADTLSGIDFVTTGANTFLFPGAGVLSTPNDQSLPNDEDDVSTGYNRFDDFKVETQTLAATYEWDIDDNWTFKSVTSARFLDNFQPYDFDGSQQDFITSSRPRESEDYSQEFQFNYASARLNAVAGLYYLDALEEIENVTDQTPRLRAVQTHRKNTFVDERTLESFSVYGSVDWDFAADWQVSVGARYTRDSKDLKQRASLEQGFFALARLNGFPDSAVLAIAPGQEAAVEAHPMFREWVANTRFFQSTTAESTDIDESWSEFTPSVKLSHFFNEDTLIYSGIATGFKSGGFNAESGAATAFDPETVTSYSVGVKTTLLENSLRINGEAFYNDYQDKQLATIVLDGANLVQRSDNVGEVSSSGAEVEINWFPLASLQVGLNIGYLDTEVKQFDSFDSSGNPVNLADRTELGFAPRWTAQLNALYDLNLGDAGNLTVGGDVSYRYKSFTNSPVDTTDRFERQQVQQEHYITNAQVSYTTLDRKWRVSLEGKNLEDKRVLSNSYVVGPFVSAAYNMPRTWGLSVAYQY